MRYRGRTGWEHLERTGWEHRGRTGWEHLERAGLGPARAAFGRGLTEEEEEDGGRIAVACYRPEFQEQQLIAYRFS